MKRDDALAYIRIAGYHNDTREYLRLYTENRVSRKAADEAWTKGVAAKKNGVPCTCYHCKA